MTTFISYAQNFEDVMLRRAFRDVAKGFFIDIGAQDPLIDSVSKAFHNEGWRGIHVEPSAHYAEMLRQQRPGDIVLQAAVSDAASIELFFEIPGTGISTLDPGIAAQHRERGFDIREVWVPTITLASVFDTCDADIIHWMKIDIEGFERRALSSWGSGSKRPCVIVVESTLPLSQVESSATWDFMLLERDYESVYFDGLNRFFVANEWPELKRAFEAPPNVFDCFALSGTSSSSFHAEIQERHEQLLATAAQEVERVKGAFDRQSEAHALALEAVESAATEGVGISEQAHASALEAVQSSAANQVGALERALEDREAKFEEQANQLQGHIRSLLEAARDREEQAASERQRIDDSQREVRTLLAAALERATVVGLELAEVREAAASTQQAHAAETHRLRERIEALHGEQLSQLEARNDLERRDKDLQREAEQRHADQLAALQERARAELHHFLDIHSLETHRLIATSEERAALAHGLSEQLANARATIDMLQRRPLNRLLRPLRRRAPSPGLALALEPSKSPATAVAGYFTADDQTPPSADRNAMKTPVLNQLLTLNDIDFVRAAYVAILGRDADPSGERNYLALLRQGYDRVGMLADMAHSDEGRRAGASIPGLKAALIWNTLGRVRVLGPLLVRVLSTFRRIPNPDPTTAFRNQSFGLQRTILDLVVEIQASIGHLQHQQAGMEQALRRMSEQQSDIAATVISIQGASDPWGRDRLPGAANAGTAVDGIAGMRGEDQALQQVQLVRRAAAWEV